jgi:hypothetical protein
MDASPERVSMSSRNRLKPGFFGANCSSDRFVTKAPERWTGGWDDNVRLAFRDDVLPRLERLGLREPPPPSRSAALGRHGSAGGIEPGDDMSGQREPVG